MCPRVVTTTYQRLLLLIVSAVFVWSAIAPRDGFVWLLEVMPVLLVLPVLFLTFAKFPLTNLVYGLIALHAIILLVGGHYTYAEMPLFSWLRDYFDWDRNYYDRLGHVAQGFVPAMTGREILLRHQILPRGRWLFFIVVCICLAISAFYEFLEWWVAIASGSEAVTFLATQGDIWDTQWDMLLAFCGAIAAQLCLSKWHDRQLAQL
jgi:putative membrane protein